MSVYGSRSTLPLARMLVNNLDNGLVEQVDDPTINIVYKLFFVHKLVHKIRVLEV